jgi:hypothetical protein
VECTDQLRDLYGPCQQMWQGTQPEGRACGFDVESFVCAPGNSCVLDLSLCGTCRARLPAGASCAETAGTCGPQGDCRDGVCLARRLVGESCSSEERCETGAKCEGGRCLGPRYVAVGEACSHRSRCPFGSACLDGVCFPASAVGHRCSTTVCATGFCDATETCVPLLPAEGSCASHEMCASGRCADGRCQAFPSACLE